MRTVRAAVALSIAAVLGAGLVACGNSQGDEFDEQLRNAGYTNVDVSADHDTTRNRKGKKKSKLDDYEATANAGSCAVTVEQDADSTDYVVQTVNGKNVSFANVTASALVAEVAKQGVTC
jgi:uncharacterized protein HemX